MKKLKYLSIGIRIVSDEVYFFDNNLGKIEGFVYICDNARYPKRVAKKVGEFISNGNAYLDDYIFEKGKWFVYLNSKGNFYIFNNLI